MKLTILTMNGVVVGLSAQGSPNELRDFRFDIKETTGSDALALSVAGVHVDETKKKKSQPKKARKAAKAKQEISKLDLPLDDLIPDHAKEQDGDEAINDSIPDPHITKAELDADLDQIHSLRSSKR